MRDHISSISDIARVQPTRLAVASEHGTVTYAQIERLVQHYADVLTGCTFPGEMVRLVGAVGGHVLAAVVACQRTGRGAFPVLPRHAGTRLDGDTSRISLVEHAPGAPLAVRGGVTPAPTPAPPAARAGYLAFRTSGTTGAPTLQRQQGRRAPHRGVAVIRRYGVGPDLGPRLLANATYHFGTVGPALHALEAGSGVVVQSAWDPARFLALADEHQVGSAILAPDMMGDLAPRVDGLPSTLTTVLHAGSPCPWAVKRVWAQRLGAGLVEHYGTSRGIATEITGDEWLRRQGSVGRALPGVRVTVRDERGDDVVSAAGRVRIAHRGGGGVEEPGDVGVLDDDGHLVLHGREAPDARPPLDAALAAVEGVRAWHVGHAAGTGAVVVAEAPSSAAAEVRGRVTRLLEVAGATTTVLVVPVGSLPRTPSGKVSRRDADRWLDERTNRTSS